MESKDITIEDLSKQMARLEAQLKDYKSQENSIRNQKEEAEKSHRFNLGCYHQVKYDPASRQRSQWAVSVSASKLRSLDEDLRRIITNIKETEDKIRIINNEIADLTSGAPKP